MRAMLIGLFLHSFVDLGGKLDVVLRGDSQPLMLLNLPHGQSPQGVNAHKSGDQLVAF